MTRSSSELQAGSSYMKSVRAGLAIAPGRERETREVTFGVFEVSKAEAEAEVEVVALVAAVVLDWAVVVRFREVRRMERVVARDLGAILRVAFRLLLWEFDGVGIGRERE